MSIEIFNDLIFVVIFMSSTGWDSEVGTATRHGLDGSRLQPRWGQEIFSTLGAHPASCTMGTGAVPGVKRTWYGVHHSPPSSVVVTVLPVCACVPCYGETFTFT